MKPVKVSPFEGVSQFLGSGLQGPHDQITTELENIVVDSSLPSDTNIWETGIRRANIEGKWVIVEQYKDKPSAEKGHAHWVKLMEEQPDFPLKDIDNWSLND